MQRCGGGEVAEAMVIDDARDHGVLKTGDGLAGLVVVAQNHQLSVLALCGGLDGVDEHGDGDAVVLKQLSGLGRQGTKAARLVGVAVELNLVQQLGQDDGRHDGVVIGVLVTKYKNVAH